MNSHSKLEKVETSALELQKNTKALTSVSLNKNKKLKKKFPGKAITGAGDSLHFGCNLLVL